MYGFPLTDADLEKIAWYVRGIMRKESKTVSEVPVVDSLDGLESLPALQVVGGVAKMVRAPVTLLSEPAWDAVKELLNQLEGALSTIEKWSDYAKSAGDGALAATKISQEQTEKCKQAVELCIEVLNHPPIVQENILYVYDIDQHKYISTGQNMKGNTFKPYLDPADGMLHWTNDGGLENPEPTRVEGNVMFATFDIDWDTGELYARTMPEYKGAGFELDEETGNFSVII